MLCYHSEKIVEKSQQRMDGGKLVALLITANTRPGMSGADAVLKAQKTVEPQLMKCCSDMPSLLGLSTPVSSSRTDTSPCTSSRSHLPAVFANSCHLSEKQTILPKVKGCVIGSFAKMNSTPPSSDLCGSLSLPPHVEKQKLESSWANYQSPGIWQLPFDT